MTVSNTTQQLIDLLTARDATGMEKYGTTLDRGDLSHAEWLQHMAEELLDAAGYALAAKRMAEKDAVWLARLEEFVGPSALAYMRRNFNEAWERAHG